MERIKTTDPPWGWFHVGSFFETGGRIGRTWVAQDVFQNYIVPLLPWCKLTWTPRQKTDTRKYTMLNRATSRYNTPELALQVPYASYKTSGQSAPPNRCGKEPLHCLLFFNGPLVKMSITCKERDIRSPDLLDLGDRWFLFPWLVKDIKEPGELDPEFGMSFCEPNTLPELMKSGESLVSQKWPMRYDCACGGQPQASSWKTNGLGQLLPKWPVRSLFPG